MEEVPRLGILKEIVALRATAGDVSMTFPPQGNMRLPQVEQVMISQCHHRLSKLRSLDNLWCHRFNLSMDGDS